MLFTSYEFLLFLLVVFVIYYLIPSKWQWAFLLVASYIFYAIASPLYLIFISVTGVTVYLAAVMMEEKSKQNAQYFKSVRANLTREERKALKSRQKRKVRNIFLASLLLNLGILAVLKYANFTIVNINAMLRTFGSNARLGKVDLVLPMGISFYSFQAVSYLIDVYNGRVKAQRNPFRLMLFVSFFPQLVQGPISRYGDLSQTLYGPHKAEKKNITFGLQRILWGFFKKLVIADRILPGVKAIIAHPGKYDGEFAFIGMLFYALELYADFTGGIDITIGTAEVLGIRVQENFIRPYFSKSIKEYWKRWHISMGNWFTDYVFYPLSVSHALQKLGRWSRKHLGTAVGKRVPVYLASFLVWLATGIWHGAAWNFVAWGLGNFVIIMISQELEPLYLRFHEKTHVEGKTWWKAIQILRTFLIMSCLRMFDCYRDVPLTFRMFGSMFTDFHITDLNASNFLSLGMSGFDYLILVMSVILLISVSVIQRSGSVREKIAARPYLLQCLIWAGLFLAVILLGAYSIGYDANQFIYNQF